MIEEHDFRKMVTKLLIKVIENPIPGKVLDLDPIFKWTILPGRQIAWYSYETGETEIWQLPDRPAEIAMTMMIKGPEMIR